MKRNRNISDPKITNRTIDQYFSPLAKKPRRVDEPEIVFVREVKSAPSILSKEKIQSPEVDESERVGKVKPTPSVLREEKSPGRLMKSKSITVACSSGTAASQFKFPKTPATNNKQLVTRGPPALRKSYSVHEEYPRIAIERGKLNQRKNKKEVIGPRELEYASKRIAQKNAWNDQHGVDGEIVMRTGFFRMRECIENRKSMKEFPYNFFSYIETYTTDMEDTGLSIRELSDLWLFIIEFLSSMTSSALYPNANIVRHVAYHGLKNHQDPKVQAASFNFLEKVIKHVYYSDDFESRRFYLALFSNNGSIGKKMNDGGEYWATFDGVLESLTKKINFGEFMFCDILVLVLEDDVFRWVDKCKKEGTVSTAWSQLPLLGWILWSGGDLVPAVNRRVKNILEYYAISILKKSPASVTKLLRRLVQLICKLIETFEKVKNTDDGKTYVINHLLEQLRKAENTCPLKRIWSEIYLVEPAWLSHHLAKGLANKRTFYQSGGLRDLLDSMKQMQITNDPLSEEEIKVAQNKSMPISMATPMMTDGTDDAAKSTKSNPWAKSKKIKRNKFGETELMIAVKKGKIEIIQSLLRDGANVNEKDYNDWTSLHEACKLGQVEIVKLLLESGADLMALGGGKEEQIKPLEDAIRFDKINVVNVIFQHLRLTNELRDVFVAQNNNLENYAISSEMIDTIKKWCERKDTRKNVDFFYAMSSLALSKYVSMYRLHAAKKIMKAMPFDRIQTHPLFELNGIYETLDIFYDINSMLTLDPFQRSNVPRAKDIRTFWLKVSKDTFYNPVLSLCNENHSPSQ